VPPRFSVVIPTRNRPASLNRCLAALGRQTQPASDFEVIVVVDGTDLEPPVVPGLQDPGPPVRVVQIPHQGPGGARNAGAAVADGEYLAFTEDDVLPAPDWLERAARHLGGDPVEVLEGRTLLEGTERSTRRAEPDPAPSFIPCNLVVRADTFDSLGGYDTRFFDPRTGLYFREDMEFGFRALEHGCRHAIDPSLTVEHPEQFESLAAALRHARRYVFDPLLYRGHRRLYRELIEVKRVLGLRLRRPLHLVSVTAVLAWVGLVLSAALGAWTVAVIAAAIALAASVAVRVKYQGQRAWRVWELPAVVVFAALPFVYLGALARGCVRARGGVGVFW
jgi:glycosyltransferase involved in cell wall biosynthesis